MDERAVTELRRLAELDADLSTRAAELRALDGQVAALRGRAEAIDAFFAVYSGEETARQAELAEAQRELTRRREELASAERARAEAQGDAAALPRELEELEAWARAVPEVPPLSSSLVEWASQAHAELFVAAGQIDVQRERAIREANELASMLLGESTYGATVAQALARVEGLTAAQRRKQ
jgi:chromosome segregation ATPase